MMNQLNKVSIILTSYNQKEKLARAFNSLVNQTYKNIEIVIVDDCSTDNVTQQYIKNVANEYPNIVRYYFQKKNVGIPKNKNTGFKLATGDFISYLDGDDYYLPNKIADEVSVFIQNPQADVVYSNFRLETEDGQFISNWCSEETIPPQGNIFDKVIQRNFPKAILFRFELMKKDVLKKINYYDTNISAYHDWDSRIRYASFANIAYCNVIGSVYVQDKQGISKQSRQVRLLKELDFVYSKNWSLLKNQQGVKARTSRQSFYRSLGESLFLHTNFGEAPKLYFKVAKLNTSYIKILIYKIFKSLFNGR